MNEDDGMEEINIKSLLEQNYIIVCDTNVYLNVYRYSPEFTEFSMKCLNEIRGKIVVPATVDIEYRKHCKSEYFAMKNRVKKATSNILSQIDLSKKKISNTCDLLKSLQYPDIDELSEKLEDSMITAEQEVENFFEDRSVLEQIADAWGKKDLISELFEEVVCERRIAPFSQSELYSICENGEERYKKQIPPGFKDAKNKDGIRKYSDLIIWKEIISYAKKNQLNIIFVTDDVKPDWWESENVFHPSLIKEFKEDTGKEILPFTSVSFYAQVANDYHIDKTDAIDIALRLTDKDYFERVEESVFERVNDNITYSGESLIESFSAHIGTEGIDELEVIDHEFIEAEQIDREDDRIIYQFKFYVEAEGTSFDYWGRDDDTKQVILSPGAYHKFEGNIIVEVQRTIETFIDYNDDSDFESVEIVSGELKEIEYKPYSDADYDDVPDAYDTCPDCGKQINHENDAGTGFCIECSPNH